MTHQDTKKYVHILPDIIESYNHTQHEGLEEEHTPNQIHKLTDNKNKIQQQFNKMYKIPHSYKPFISTLSVGEYVCLSNIKPTFKKGYTVQNTLEIFKIIRVHTSQSPTVYYLKDLQGEPINGIILQQRINSISTTRYLRY